MSTRSSLRRRGEDSIASIPDLPLGGGFEADTPDQQPTKSIFDPSCSDATLGCDTDCDAPSISSSSSKSKASKAPKKPQKGKKNNRLSEITEDAVEDCQSVARDEPKKNKRKKGMKSNSEDNPKAQSDPKSSRQTRKVTKQTTKKSDVEQTVSTPGISARLRKRRDSVVQKENTPPTGERRSTKPVGTQVNARMLPRAAKNAKKNPTKNLGNPVPLSSNQPDQILRAPRKSRSRERRSGPGSETSTSTRFPPSSSPLHLISPIPSSGANGPIPLQDAHVDNTMDDIPSISSDHQPSPRTSGNSQRARRSISIEIASEVNTQPNDRNVEPASSTSEPASSSSNSSSTSSNNNNNNNNNNNEKQTSDNFVINCQAAVSIEFSSEILKRGGEITIKPKEESKPKTSKLNDTRAKATPKLSFGTLGGLKGKQRRLTSWSSDSESDDSCECSDDESDSESSSSTSSYSPCSIPHSKKMCKKCSECDYCCVCRR